MKNDTSFVRMRSGDHLGDAKCPKRYLAPSNFTFLLIAIDRHVHVCVCVCVCVCVSVRVKMKREYQTYGKHDKGES